MHIQQRKWTADDVATLSSATAFDPFGGLASPAECLARCYLFELIDDDGRQFALLAVEPFKLAHGAELQIVAGVKTAAGPGMPAVLKMLEPWGRSLGANVLSFVTSRRPVERLAHRAGWQTTGAIVTRRLTPEH